MKETRKRNYWKDLEDSLEMRIVDLQQGKWNQAKKQRESAELPWLHIQKTLIYDVEGWLITDRLMFFDEFIQPISEAEAIDKIQTGYAFFATAQDLPRASKTGHVTHMIYSTVGIDRLEQAIRETFASNLLLIWRSDQIDSLIVTNCYVNDCIREATSKGRTAVRYRLGNYSDILRTLTESVTISPKTTSHFGACRDFDFKEVAAQLNEYIRDFVPELTQAYESPVVEKAAEAVEAVVTPVVEEAVAEAIEQTAEEIEEIVAETEAAIAKVEAVIAEELEVLPPTVSVSEPLMAFYEPGTLEYDLPLGISNYDFADVSCVLT